MGEGQHRKGCLAAAGFQGLIIPCSLNSPQWLGEWPGRVGLERIPEELFSLRAMETTNLTGNTFAKNEYNALDRLAKSHPKIKVLMARSSAKKRAPPAASSDAPLAKSIQEDLDRLGVIAPKSDKPIRELRIGETAWPVPSALAELLSRSLSGRTILAPVDGDDMQRFSLGYYTAPLQEFQYIRDDPYVVLGDTPNYSFLVLRLDDKKSADPMLYMLDSDDFRAHEARQLERLSDWLKKARPADGEPPGAKKSARAPGASGTAKKKRRAKR